MPSVPFLMYLAGFKWFKDGYVCTKSRRNHADTPPSIIRACFAEISSALR